MGSNWQEKILLNINKVNRTLDYGSFEVDLESGDIRYRTYFNPGNAVYWEDLDMFLGIPDADNSEQIFRAVQSIVSIY